MYIQKSTFFKVNIFNAIDKSFQFASDAAAANVGYFFFSEMSPPSDSTWITKQSILFQNVCSAISRIRNKFLSINLMCFKNCFKNLLTKFSAESFRKFPKSLYVYLWGVLRNFTLFSLFIHFLNIFFPSYYMLFLQILYLCSNLYVHCNIKFLPS